MKLAGFHIYRYALPFTEPVTLKGTRLRSREGLLLELTGETGVSGWGETSPLPGFSRESLDDAGRQLRELAASFVGHALFGDRRFPDGPSDCDSDYQELAPSVRFGFELTAWNLYAASQGKTLPEVVSEKPGASVSLNGLLAGSEERVLEEARRMLGAGYEAAKLKVGSRSVRDDVELAGKVAEIFGDAVALRLDANRAWDFEEAVEFFRLTSDLRYEYVEEPLAEPSGLPRLAGEYGVPVALDESLVGMKVEGLKRHRYARAVVLKPTLLGGLSCTMLLAREAEGLGISPVISSAYETGIGTKALIFLAASIGGGEIPAGLDTYRRLAADVLEPALDLSAPRVNVREAFGHRPFASNRFERIYSSEI